MKSLVHAEVQKLRTTRTTLWLLLATIGTEALMLAFSVPKRDAPDALVPLDDPGLMAALAGTGLLIAQVLVAVFGVLSFGQEYRYQTITSTYLVEPRRPRVLLAKLVAAGLSSAVVVAATMVLVVPVGTVIIGSRDGNITLGTQFWQVVGAGFVVLAATAVMAVAVGALVRNQVAAIAGVLVWMTVVQQLVISELPRVGRWLPGGATMSMLQQGPATGLDGELLSPVVAALLLLVYVLVAITLTVVVTTRRDVL